MMGVTSLEVYNTVYNITGKKNKFETQEQLIPLNVDFEILASV